MGLSLGEGEVEVLQQRLALDAAGWLIHADTRRKVTGGIPAAIQFKSLEPLGNIVIGWVDSARGLALLLCQDGTKFEPVGCEYTHISSVRPVVPNQQGDCIVQAVSASGDNRFFVLDRDGRKILPKQGDRRFGGSFDGLTQLHAGAYAIAIKYDYSFLINRDGKAGSRFPLDVYIAAEDCLKKESEMPGAGKLLWKECLAIYQARITSGINKYAEAIATLEREMVADILSDRAIRPDVNSRVPAEMQRLLDVYSFILSMLQVDQRYLDRFSPDKIELVRM